MLGQAGELFDGDRPESEGIAREIGEHHDGIDLIESSQQVYASRAQEARFESELALRARSCFSKRGAAGPAGNSRRCINLE